MNAPDYESIWQQSFIRVTDKFSLPPIDTAEKLS